MKDRLFRIGHVCLGGDDLTELLRRRFAILLDWRWRDERLQHVVETRAHADDRAEHAAHHVVRREHALTGMNYGREPLERPTSERITDTACDALRDQNGHECDRHRD